MERKVGEAFRYKSKILQVQKDVPRTPELEGCDGCYFDSITTSRCVKPGVRSVIGYCGRKYRKDGQGVIFTEVKDGTQDR